jgi:hypothetical protein
MSPRCVFAALIAAISLAIPASAALADEATELKEKVFAAWKAREEKVPRFTVTWDAEYTQSLEDARLYALVRRAPMPTSGWTSPMNGFSLSMDKEKIALDYYLIGEKGGTKSRLINIGTVQTEFIRLPHESYGRANVHGSVEFSSPRQWMVSPVFFLYRSSMCFTTTERPTALTATVETQSSTRKGRIILIENTESKMIRYFLGPEPHFVVERIESDRRRTEESSPGTDSPESTFDRVLELDVEYTPTARDALPRIAGWKVTKWENWEKKEFSARFTARVTNTVFVETFPASQFDPYDFPVGTRVFEGKSGDGLWIQGENGQREPYVATMPAESVRPHPPEFADSLRRPTSLYEYGFFCSLLVFVLALLAWWWRR